LPLKAVEPRRLYRQIAEQLRELIDNGEYPIGGRLPSERELADGLRVSRPSVREALIALEVQGLVRINVGSGIYVLGTSGNSSPRWGAGVPPGGPFEILHAREIIEASVASEAATLARPEHIEAIDRVLSRMDESGARSDEWIALDREFHVTIAAALENEVLVRFVGQLFDQRINPYFERLASYFEDDNTWRRALAEHREIRDAIANGDSEAARFAMRHHLKLSQERFSRGFGEPVTPPLNAGKTRPAIRSRAVNPLELPIKANRRKRI
jgi:DNA-binding FadR family transcriptional regulator